MSLYNDSTQKETIITSIAGMERCDFVMNIMKLVKCAKMLTKKNTYNSVLVLDNSVNHELFNLATIDGIEDVADYRGITIVKDVAYSHDEFLNYDHVIVYHGMNIDKKLLEISDHIYIFVNYEKNLNKTLGAQLCDISFEQNNVTIIYRDKAFKKITERNINHYIGVKEKDIKAQYVMKHDLKDYALYLAMTHNGSQAIKNYSDDYANVLFTIMQEILLWDAKKAPKYFKKLIKKAK